MHRRRLLVTVSASALILLGSLPLPALAAGPDRTFDRVDVGKVDPLLRPTAVDPEKQVTVILQLAGRPALGVASTAAGQRAAADRLRAAQRAIAADVRAAGAKVTGRYQYTFNGLRVDTTLGRLPALARIPGVAAVKPVPTYKLDNANGVPAIGAPTAWGVDGATGEGTVIAVIDTGIDYEHANFGGSGDAADFENNDGTVIEPDSFPTAKVIDGYDFAGDAYDASANDATAIPDPDPDPIDCNGHGSHVAGSAAGMGVLADHSTYDGAYDEETIGDSEWVIGPGVAPEAKLIALKVFGCDGSTDVVVEALEWVGWYNATHVTDIDVVNMSLGSPFGTNSDVDSMQTNTLVGRGVVVVTSAGNESAVPYITGSPGAATKSISVAAMDANATLPMATVDTAGDDFGGINQNAFPGLPVAGDLFVVDNGSGGISLGCEADDFPAGVSGKIAVVKRGVCAFVDKGMYAEMAGAIGIIVINRDDVPPSALPTFLGYNPEIFDIPMVGLPNTVPGSDPAESMDDALIALDGDPVTLNDAGTQANPAYNAITSFSSSGPRWGDSWLKPDIAAPGASVVSTLVGGGWKGTTLSGTSMAAPMTAGAAALVVQGHPAWTPLQVKAALVNTADADVIEDYDPERSGSGLVQVDLAVNATVVATTSDGTASLNYGYRPTGGAWSLAKTITFWNDWVEPVEYSLAATSPLVKLSASSITVPAGGSASVTATASLSASQVRALPSADDFVTGLFGELISLDGAVVATPVAPAAPAEMPFGQHTLRIPYLLVPRGASHVKAEAGDRWRRDSGRLVGKIELRNPSRYAGNADVYALGAKDPAGDGDGANGTDIRATGVQVLPGAALGGNASDRSLLFAVNMHDRFSNAAPHFVDVLVDVDLDGAADFDIWGVDGGWLFSGAWDGVFINVLYDLNADEFVTEYNPATDSDEIVGWLADAPRNGSTVLLPALASYIGLDSSNPRFQYAVVTTDGYTGGSDQSAWSKVFDAFNPKISTGNFKTVDPRSTARVPAWYKKSAKPRGWLVITLDDRNGSFQGDIVRVPR